MKSAITACFVALALVSLPLHAEPAAPNASYKKTFEKFLEVSQSNAVLNELSNGKSLDQIIALATKGDMPKAQKDKVTRIVRDTFSSLAKDLEAQMLLLYSKYYTEQDLNDLIALYQTPAGKKLANNALAIFNDSQELAQNLLLAYLPKMEAQIRQIAQETKK